MYYVGLGYTILFRVWNYVMASSCDVFMLMINNLLARCYVDDNYVMYDTCLFDVFMLMTNSLLARCYVDDNYVMYDACLYDVFMLMTKKYCILSICFRMYVVPELDSKLNDLRLRGDLEYSIIQIRTKKVNYSSTHSTK
jgi:hypothetical protein